MHKARTNKYTVLILILLMLTESSESLILYFSMTPTFGHDFARNQPNDMSQYLKRDISNYKANENWRGGTLEFRWLVKP